MRKNRLVKTLPKLAKAAESNQLRAGFEEHLEQTKGHVDLYAQRVEHYEIATYGCVKTWAGSPGETEAQSLLERTFNEEKQADEKITELSADIKLSAIGNEQDQDSNLEEFGEEIEEATNRPLKSKSRGAGAN